MKYKIRNSEHELTKDSRKLANEILELFCAHHKLSKKKSINYDLNIMVNALGKVIANSILNILDSSSIDDKEYCARGDEIIDKLINGVGKCAKEVVRAFHENKVKASGH